jgi:cytochrome c-type biogenesis protein CcmF
MALTVAGVGFTTGFSQERDLRMAAGERAELAGYQFQFVGTEPRRGPNYLAERGTVLISRDGEPVAELHPEKRRYHARGDQLMTEAAIDANLWRDLYVALGEPLGEGAWAVRLHYKPFVRWIWLGAIWMAVGGGLAAADKRYRLGNRNPRAADTAVAAQ